MRLEPKMDLKPSNFVANDAHAANSWLNFKQCFNVFVVALGLENERRKCNLLLHCMGAEGFTSLTRLNSDLVKQNYKKNLLDIICQKPI